jgi:hypothetical protein
MRSGAEEDLAGALRSAGVRAGGQVWVGDEQPPEGDRVGPAARHCTLRRVDGEAASGDNRFRICGVVAIE